MQIIAEVQKFEVKYNSKNYSLSWSSFKQHLNMDSSSQGELIWYVSVTVAPVFGDLMYAMWDMFT